MAFGTHYTCPTVDRIHVLDIVWSVDITIIQIVVEPFDDLLLARAHLKLLRSETVVPYFATISFGLVLPEIGSTCVEAGIIKFLKIT